MLFDWTNRTIGAGDPEYQEAGKTPQETAMAAMTELFLYFAKLVEEKKQNPADDLITLFANARVDGEPLPPMDVLAYCLIIVVAGNETTRNATTGGMLAFVEHQDELRKLQANPALLPSAVEEVVRWAQPDHPLRAHRHARTTSCAASASATATCSALFYPSANRDEEVFDATRTSSASTATRTRTSASASASTSASARTSRASSCMVAYKHLLPRIEEIELAGPVERLHSALVGGVKHLPIRYKLKPL